MQDAGISFELGAKSFNIGIQSGIQDRQYHDVFPVIPHVPVPEKMKLVPCDQGADDQDNGYGELKNDQDVSQSEAFGAMGSCPSCRLSHHKRFSPPRASHLYLGL